MKDEKEIINRILSGDSDAFSEIVGRYKADVFSIVTRQVPNDRVAEVSQAAFIRAFKSLHTFRGDAPFKHWLAKLAVRTCIDFWRKERRNKEVNITSLHFALLDGENSLELFNERETVSRAKEILDWALGKLGADDRILISLLYIEDRSEKETAEIMGWSISKVKGRAFRSRRFLVKEINKYLTRITV